MEDQDQRNTAYIYLPQNTNTFPKVLTDLGKATKRGIKKCYKCGIYNGTRGIVCKNKQCDAVFKDSGFRKTPNLDSFKLITGNSRQVFSVRVRDTDSDHRGFVQLPVLQSHVQGELLSEVALCFVDSCQRLFDHSILQCHESDFPKPSSLCIHIKSALKSKNLATVLEIKREVLNLLKVRTNLKETLWHIANEKDGPLVQRISKNVMAVKCQVTPKHPLGYLHFRFLPLKAKDNYSCSCTESVGVHGKYLSRRIKCLHYFACICALASHPKYFEEFQQLVSLELPADVSIKETVPAVVSNYLSSASKFKNNVSIKHLNRVTKVKRIHKRAEKDNKLRKLMPKASPLQVKIVNEKRTNVIHKWCNEDMSNSSFSDWLASAIECVNGTMVLENCVIMNILIFHVPIIFCKALFERITNNSCKDMHETMIHIDNEILLKQIFDTPKVKLMTEKHLIEVNSSLRLDMVDKSIKCIVQFDFDSSHNEAVDSFIIEWLPEVLDATNLGQLKFKYKLKLSMS